MFAFFANLGKTIARRPRLRGADLPYQAFPILLTTKERVTLRYPEIPIDGVESQSRIQAGSHTISNFYHHLG